VTRRIAILAADGFEKVELAIPMNALKLAGAEVDIVSLRKGGIRGVNPLRRSAPQSVSGCSPLE
jgi:protease I